MTDLLPIVFQRGVNESVDARVAPPDVHCIARNVRWRKDGRPAKRYGVTALTTIGLSTFGFDTQPVNALASWGQVPVIAVGSSVRQLTATGEWNKLPGVDISELSHFGPGERDIVARDEAGAIGFVTSALVGNMVVHVWSLNAVLLCWCVKGLDGSYLITPRVLASGNNPRAISATNFVYILSQNGTTLELRVFDPSNLSMSTLASPGTLDASTSHFDACGRGSDFLIAYQSAVNTITVKLFTAVATPVLQQTQTTFAVASGAYVGIVGNSTSQVFVAVTNTNGVIGYAVFPNALNTAQIGGVAIETDVNNGGQPGIVLESNTVAQVIWGGFVTATESSYMRIAQVSSAGVLSTIGSFYGVAPASKPFMGPVYSTLGSVDGTYIWVATHNANNGSTKWDSQRAYYLLKVQANNSNAPRRQMHVPSCVPGAFAQNHLSDVLNLGTGYGYLVPLLNAIRNTASGNPALGFDAVTVRSIFESSSMAARDTNMAGRVLQFSGGSLFEFSGVAEETGFSNFPVIQSIVGGGGGGLTGGATYIYRAVYEWLDLQGRRHRSAPSDPFTFASGANSSATLTMKPLIADSHFRNGAGSTTQSGVTLHVYRTLANQSTFHRVTPNTGAPVGSSAGVATVSFIDLMSDATAAAIEFIYTDGGVADNTLCPPHQFQAVCNGRLWVAGQLDRCVVTASKILVDGEPSQFSDLDQFSVFLPQKCTGLASIDGTVVAFARERIYFITGDGPDDQGIGSFNPPVELPTDVGCIDWRSIVETSIGIFFQGKRGIYLLPRGFNTPVFVGAEVEETLAQYPRIVSATLVSIPSNDSVSFGEITVRFVVGTNDVPSATSVLVYDLRTGGWSVDELGNGPLLSGTWSDAFITSRLSGGVLALQSESAAGIGYADFFGSFITTTLGTGDIRPFGVAGYGQFCKVALLGEFRGSCKVNVQVSVDGATPDTFSYTITSPDGPNDNSVCLDVTPKIQKGAAIRITCFDSGNPTAISPSEGFIMQSVLIEHELIGKTKRLAAARKA